VKVCLRRNGSQWRVADALGVSVDVGEAGWMNQQKRDSVMMRRWGGG
jgi:hypothetical protein